MQPEVWGSTPDRTLFSVCMKLETLPVKIEIVVFVCSNFVGIAFFYNGRLCCRQVSLLLQVLLIAFSGGTQSFFIKSICFYFNRCLLKYCRLCFRFKFFFVVNTY